MPENIIESTCGKLEGKDLDGASVWKGIPYAAPPVGELRFRPSVPRENINVIEILNLGEIKWKINSAS